MLVVRSEDHLQHHCLELHGAVLIPSWEGPDRAERVDDAIDNTGLGPVIGPSELDHEIIERVHDPAYIEFLATAWDRWVSTGHEAPSAMGNGWPTRRLRSIRPTHIDAQLGYYSFAADCSITAGTWPAALASAAIADTAARHVADTGEPAFARCRPPGHHATRDQFGGYCYLNNAAVAAERLLDSGARRVAIIDVDYHHGNGTQDIFYGRDDVAFCSIHSDPLEEFPYFLGHRDEIGDGPGEGWNLNLPLSRGTEAPAWFAALSHGTAWIEAAGADALVVSLGVDTYELDPISHFRLGADHYPMLGAALAGLGLPTVLIMEGGYATAQVGANVAAVLTGFVSG